jgi:hypothetical protein
LDTGEFEARHKTVGWCSSEAKAAKKSEEAVRVRDGNPGDMEGNPNGLQPKDLLATHFR